MDIIVGLNFKICLFALALLLSDCSKDEEVQENDVYLNQTIFISNQSYGEHPRNTMDLFLPAKPFNGEKAVILIHGGGWCEGDKADFIDFAYLLADSGITTVAINYRYADSLNGINYNHILSDIDNSISYLRSNTETYNCTFNKLTLLGMSAGAHLSLLYAYKMDRIEVENVISLAGPTHLTDSLLLAVPGMTQLLHNLIGIDNDSSWIDASPIHYPSTVATHLYHGKLDSIVPYQQSEQLFEKIQTLNSAKI